MSGLTGESQTPGQPGLMGLADDNIWTERTLVEKLYLPQNIKQLAPGGLSGERLGCVVACRQLAKSSGPTGRTPPTFIFLPPYLTPRVCEHTHTHTVTYTQVTCDEPTNFLP